MGLSSIASLAAISALFLIPTLTEGRIFSGTINGDINPYVGKFAYAADSSGNPVGTMSINYHTTQASVAVLEFDDDAWVNAETANCATQVGMISGLEAGTDTLPLPSSESFGSMDFIEVKQPHYWYFVIANYPSCAPVQLSYTITCLDANGGHLSYDEIGLPSTYGCFFALFLIGTLVHAWYHYFPNVFRKAGHANRKPFSPLLVKVLTASLATATISLFFHLIDWSNVSKNGVNLQGVEVMGGLTRIASHMYIWVMAFFAARGTGITVPAGPIFSKKNLLPMGLLTLLFALYISLMIWYLDVRNPANPSSTKGNSAPGILLLIVMIGYASWFGYKIRNSIIAESQLDRKRMLKRLAFVIGGHFLVLPLAEIVAASCPTYYRARVSVGLDNFFLTIAYAATCWCLWPSVAENAFPYNDDNLWMNSGNRDMTDAFMPAFAEAYSSSDYAYHDIPSSE